MRKMGEVKAVSFRINEEDMGKFREFAEEKGLNQAEMFQSLVNSFEMARAKGQITDRAKEVETFQATVNNLITMFINSLATNQTSEDRIREQLSLELNTKDKTINDLQEERQKLREELKKALESSKELELKAKENESAYIKTSKDLEQKSDIVNSQQEQINTLNGIITEYKQYKENNVLLENDNKELVKTNAELTHEVKDLEGKLANIEDMKEFYINQVELLKGQIKKSEEDKKAMELSHKAEVQELRVNIENKAKEEFKEKLELEKSRAMVDLQKANNKNELLGEKYNAIKEQLEKASNNMELLEEKYNSVMQHNNELTENNKTLMEQLENAKPKSKPRKVTTKAEE